MRWGKLETRNYLGHYVVFFLSLRNVGGEQKKFKDNHKTEKYENALLKV